MTPLIPLLLACAGNKTVEPAPAAPTPPEAAPAPAPAPERVSTIAGGSSRAAPSEAYAPRALGFAKRFHEGLSGPESNSVTSGASAGFALGMLALGADGASAEAFRTLYGTDDLESVRVDDARALAAYRDTAGVELSVADAVWHDEGLAFAEEAQARLAGDYRASVGPLPFSRDPGAAKASIDAWTREQTAGMIEELFSQDALAGAKMVLANAIAFKGDWVKPFDPGATESLPFATPSGSVEVPTMKDPNRKARFASGEGYASLMLPYTGDTTSMVLVLPDEGNSLDDALAGLDAEQLLALGSAPAIDVDLRLPRFHVESEHDLLAHAEDLGLTDVFGSTYPGYGGLTVGSAIQKVVVTVDEKGTEAAAATGIAMKRMALKKVAFHADRPFWFVIWHHETKTPLFVGQIVDPS